MKQKLEQLAREKATQFAALLNGRYRKHISDQFMIAYLVRDFMCEVRTNRTVLDDLENAAYAAAAPLFEGLLEQECKTGGNGHHVAQNFASLFVGELHLITA
jgi:hypothetical protein